MTFIVVASHFPRRFVGPTLPEAVGAAATGVGAVPVAVPACCCISALAFCLAKEISMKGRI